MPYFPSLPNLTILRFLVYLRTHAHTHFQKLFRQYTNVEICKIVDKITGKQKKTIVAMARKGCTISEVGTALGFTQGQMAHILEDENHPFNVIYWSTKVEYTQRLRDFAMEIAENGDDVAVRAKMVEFLAKENSEAFENKRLHTGYTNIRKLLSLVRRQFVDEDGKPPIIEASAALRRKRLAQRKEVLNE